MLDKEADPNKPDYYIKYCLDETMKALDKAFGARAASPNE